MRAAVYHGPRDLRLESVLEPEPGPGDVKLRVIYNGICGSDLHEYYDGPVTTRTTPHPLTGVKNPVILGHELCGEVMSCGAGIEDLSPGDLVAVEPLETCGRCAWCTAGQYNHCPEVALHGYNRNGGGLAEYTVVRRSMAHRLPPGMTPMQGALIEPLAVAWHTANRCRLEAGQTVAIHGAGPIGIGVCLTLKARGIDVIIIDPSPLRRRVLKGLGAREVLDPADCDPIAAIRDLTGGRGAHASVDAAGVPAAFNAMLHGTRVDGTAVVVAIHHVPVVIPPFDLLMPEVNVTGVAMSAHAFPSVIEAMARGIYPLEEWVETIPFEALVERGIERLRRQEGLKILVDVRPGAARKRAVAHPEAVAGAAVKIGELFNVDGYGVIVTGGASGLGLGYAEALAENGARVTLLDVDGGRIANETRRLQGLGFAVRGEVVDVRDHAAIDRAFDAALAAHGRLDVVFANAGIDPGPGFVGSWAGTQRPRNPEGALENYTDERWNRVLDVNLNGIFATLRAGARLMRPQRSGRMIVTTSVAAYQCEPAIGAAYMTAKAGAAHLMRQVALELAAHGITVNAIAPGFFATNIGGGHAKQPQVQEAMSRVIPMHRVGIASDIKGLALFLASPASAYLTGQQISIDGGWTLGVAD